jgi:dGTPase
MLKYPWRYGNAPSDARDGSTRWGYYKSEEDIVAWAAGNELHAPGRTIDHHGRRQSEYRSVEAQILDWADDISYAIHDVEDFYRVGLVPLHHLVSSKDEWQSFFDYTWDRKLSKLFGEDESALWALGRHVINETFPKEQYEGTQADRIALHGFASNLIKDATDGTKVTTEGIITIEDQQLAKIELLKQLTWYYVLERPSLETLRRGQRALIRSLYDHLVDWVREVWDGEPLPPPKYGRNRSRRRGPHLPSRLTEYLNVSKFSDPEPEDALDSSDVETQLITRAVVDYIASLTELQAVELNARLSGQSSNSMLDSWFLS